MSDALTNYLVDRTRTAAPFVLKYIPYGNLTEVSTSFYVYVYLASCAYTTQVMPYLSRRAIENNSVLGNGAAAEERKRAAGEMWARVFA